MKKMFFTAIALVCIMLLANGCKDPREKTVWDYIDSKTANSDEFSMGIEKLHKDLIKHGYMKDHSCFQLDCYNNHKNTYEDIERVNKLVKGSE